MGRKRWEVGGGWLRGENGDVGVKERCVVGGREEALVLMVGDTKVGMAFVEVDKIVLIVLLV